MKTRYSYIYGSAAPKLPEQPQRERRQERNIPPVRKKAVEPEPRTFPLGQMVICILIGFGILFTMIFRFSALTEMNCKLASMKQEYEELKDSNRKLQAEIGAQINLENVRKIAEERLGMKMPDSYQRVPVKVPKINYSLVTGTIPEEKDSVIGSWLSAFLNH